MNDLKHVREVLEGDESLRWGFLICCCSYDDDEKWQRFMDHLNTRARLNLREEGAKDLFDRIDWAVREDEQELEGAPSSTARDKFAEWVESSGENDDWLGTPRFLACAMVTKKYLESVLEGPPAEDFDADGSGFLALVSLDEDEGYQLVGASYLVPRIYSLMQRETVQTLQDHCEYWAPCLRRSRLNMDNGLR